MNKNIKSIVMAITLSIAPLYAGIHHGHGYHGHGGALIAPAVLGTAALTGAMVAASKPQTIVMQQSDHDNLKNTVQRLQRENKMLRKKIKQQDKAIAKLQKKQPSQISEQQIVVA